jgi:Domain of unknown function (DUF4340)
MSRQSTRLLGVFAGVLAIAVVAVNLTDRGTAPAGELLLPGLKSQLNALDNVQIVKGDATVTIARVDDRWVVREQDDYPADAGKLREAMLALADANKLEAKTANPDLHAQLELAGDGTRLDLAGDSAQGFEPVSLILGKIAQGSNRYVRMSDDPQSWLIDKNPGLTADAASWLQKDVIDLAASRMQSIVISHANGEEIRIVRDAGEILSVENIPEGRELSSISALNNIAAGLQNLTLDTVRAADAAAVADLQSTYTTSDGLVVTVQRFTDGDEAWFSFAATQQEAEPPVADGDVSGDEAANSASADGGEAAPESGDDAQAAPDADAINAKLAGWWYRLPTYKSNSLGRRWSDLLDDEADE